MKNMSNLPEDMVEEVLTRIPLTSLRRVRSTCKKWNTLSKRRSFAKKYLEQQAKVAAATKGEFMGIAMMEHKVYLMRFNFHKNVDSCIKREGKLISIDKDSVEVDISQVFHCEGLVLCVSEDATRLLVWNPYFGQPRRIEPSYKFPKPYLYALGYDKSSKSHSHKVLVFVDYIPTSYVEFKIYDLNSDSWRVLDITPDNWMISSHDRGVSLKGNTYWFARGMSGYKEDNSLVCFDFTSETFGPRLPLPTQWLHDPSDNVTLSSVREEQLAILYQPWDNTHMDIWITTKIEPNAVSWNSKVFLQVDMRPLTCIDFQFLLYASSFFVDEENQVAVVFDKCKDEDTYSPNVAFIVGVDGSLKEAHLGECPLPCCFPLVCSYVPSLVQL